MGEEGEWEKVWLSWEGENLADFCHGRRFSGQHLPSKNALSSLSHFITAHPQGQPLKWPKGFVLTCYLINLWLISLWVQKSCKSCLNEEDYLDPHWECFLLQIFVHRATSQIKMNYSFVVVENSVRVPYLQLRFGWQSWPCCFLPTFPCLPGSWRFNYSECSRFGFFSLNYAFVRET